MLTGPECSLLAFVSNGKAFCMAPAQDHKRAYDGDLGPNTGGMGVYSPVPIVTEEEMATMISIMEQSAAATAKDPFENDYRGCLYGGFMLTPEGPKVLEFNARFGDPETQVVLPRLEGDLVNIMLAVAEGRPEDIVLSWSDKWAVSVVLASEGYPGSYEKGKVILGLEEAQDLDGVIVFHAGTALNPDGELITAGGRVLNVVALGDTFEEAMRHVSSLNSKAFSTVPILAAVHCRAVLPGNKLLIESRHPLRVPRSFLPALVRAIISCSCLSGKMEWPGNPSVGCCGS